MRFFGLAFSGLLFGLEKLFCDILEILRSGPINYVAYCFKITRQMTGKQGFAILKYSMFLLGASDAV